MLEHKMLFTADLHGNIKQYRTLLDYATQIKPLTIIIGGDIAPKNIALDTTNSKYIESQRTFLEIELPKLIRPFKKKFPKTNIFLILGNDDCSANIDVLNKRPELYKEINGKREKIDENHEIVGYSFVPITPFGIKDFEKFDLSEVPESIREEYEFRKKINYRLNGIRSVNRPDLSWSLYQFEKIQEKKDSIQKDLKSEIFTRSPQKTIYVFHTPPNNTSLDIIQSGMHVGSFAVREFIEQQKPKLTLHGHIHETVDISGEFKEQIGESTLISAGNHNYSSNLSIIIFDLYDINAAKRIILDCENNF